MGKCLAGRQSFRNSRCWATFLGPIASRCSLPLQVTDFGAYCLPDFIADEITLQARSFGPKDCIELHCRATCPGTAVLEPPNFACAASRKRRLNLWRRAEPRAPGFAGKPGRYRGGVMYRSPIYSPAFSLGTNNYRVGTPLARRRPPRRPQRSTPAGDSAKRLHGEPAPSRQLCFLQQFNPRPRKFPLPERSESVLAVFKKNRLCYRRGGFIATKETQL